MSRARVEMLSDGARSSTEIAEILGVTPRYVRKVQKKYGFPQLSRGAQAGKRNHQYKFGRHIQLDGYAILQKGKNGRPHISEHRYLLSEHLGRELLKTEVVDHIDGLTLNNDISNLRLFPDNATHLRETTTGKPHQVSHSGRYRKIGQPPVDTYRRRKERGDVRLQQILLAALKLGIDSPHLYGSHQWLEKEHIDPASRSSLERALHQLKRRYELDLAL